MSASRSRISAEVVVTIEKISAITAMIVEACRYHALVRSAELTWSIGAAAAVAAVAGPAGRMALPELP